MRSIVNYINEGKTVDLYHPVSNADIKRSIKKLDPSEWSKIDTSKVKNMTDLFNNYKGDFGDISGWDVSNVEKMESMFMMSSFNGDISEWDVSNVKDMYYMFYGSKFNGDISKWDVSNVKDMTFMFGHSDFNQDISNWNISKVKDMYGMFKDSKFNQDISKWDVSKVKDMRAMFEKCPLEKNLPVWFNNDKSNYISYNITMDYDKPTDNTKECKMAFDLIKKHTMNPIIYALKKLYGKSTKMQDRLSELYSNNLLFDMDAELTPSQENKLWTPKVIDLISTLFKDYAYPDVHLADYIKDMKENGDLDEFLSMLK